MKSSYRMEKSNPEKHLQRKGLSYWSNQNHFQKCNDAAKWEKMLCHCWNGQGPVSSCGWNPEFLRKSSNSYLHTLNKYAQIENWEAQTLMWFLTLITFCFLITHLIRSPIDSISEIVFILLSFIISFLLA